MDKLKILFVSLSALFLLALQVQADQQLLDNVSITGSRIDPALQELMNSGADKEIPVIVIAKGQVMPDLKGLKVRYKYHLISGVAGDARPSEVMRLASSNAVKGIYLDGLARVAEPINADLGNETICPATIINADKLWAKGIDGRGVTVAILDSGIDKNHPDLAGRVVGEKNFVEDEATTDDLLGHGTLVSGLVAGSGAASGGKYKGVAPGASLLNVKVINKAGDGRLSDIIAGIEWALDNNADILSLSLGGMNLGETNPPITMAADNAVDAGVVVCVAAGNRNNTQSPVSTGTSSLVEARADSRNVDMGMFDISQSRGHDREVLLLLLLVPLAPGLIDSPGDGVKVITLGASDLFDRIASFSGSGPTRDGRTKPSVVAPGVNVASTVPPGLENLDYLDIYYAKQSGTSLSTPVAAGLAALLLQAHPGLTPAGVKASMTLGAKRLNNSQEEPYEEYYQGTGRLDANRSYQILNADLCGTMPDAWNAGRWAYLGAGKGLYVGLDTGADRPQKKIYALAPGDDEISSQFVFFTDKAKENISTTVKGQVSDWITLQPLPKNIPANGQKVFGATISVPNGTLPGDYTGSIEIAEGNKTLSSIPVNIRIAKPLSIQRGSANMVGRLDERRWQYYYLDVPLGTSELSSRLSWRQDTDLDLFLLSPTSEYYAGEGFSLAKDLDISNPPSGRWLVAVHSRNLTAPVNYTLSFVQSLIETSPKSWIAGAVPPSGKATAQFKIVNKGPALKNMSYISSIENSSLLSFKGSIGNKDLLERSFDVPNGTSKLYVNMTAEDGTNDIAFLLLDPGDKRIFATVGPESVGTPEVIAPEPGTWRIWVYGNTVPVGQNESFNVEIMRYQQGAWRWLSTEGPSALESDSIATLKASLNIPANASSQVLDGDIEILSGNQSFMIPVSLIVGGATLGGLDYASFDDRDSDGFYDLLSLGFAVNVTAPGNYTLEGALVDCQSNMIEWLRASSFLKGSGDISIDVDGKMLWRQGGCGPMKVSSLFLYNDRGDLVDYYNKSITIERSPQEFQPPAAYFDGSFLNQTTTSDIGIGVGIRVIKAGSYDLSGIIEDDQGEELGKDTVATQLEPGNRTVTLKINPAKFIMFGRSSRMHLLDLTLKLDGAEVDHIDDAWSSEEIDPGHFKGGHSIIRTDGGRVIIP
jgi:subtilisin family serine protease